MVDDYRCYVIIEIYIEILIFFFVKLFELELDVGKIF